MQVSYKRELNHNYLMIEDEKEINADGYEMQMITHNSIASLLVMSIKYINAKVVLYYEISSKQSMQKIYENKELGYEELKKFLFQFHKMLLTAEEYLINSNYLIIDPEYIYLNIETNEISLIYCPWHEKNSKEAFQKLIEYILNRVDHQDEKAVLLAYKVYKDTRNKNFTIEEILDFSGIENNETLNQSRGNEFEEITIFSEESSITGEIKESVINKKEETVSETANEVEATDFMKTKDKKYYFITSIFLIILAGLLYLKYSDLLPDSVSYDQFLILLGAAVMIITGSIFKICLDRKRYKMKQEEKSSIEWKETEEYEVVSVNSSDTNRKDNFHEIFKNMVTEEVSMYGDTVLLGNVGENLEKRILQAMIKGKNMVYQIDHLPFTVGKLGGCVDLELKDDSISRMHARFFEQEGKMYLEDLNSTNGTFKNGMRLDANETVKVEVEDEISFAKLTFVYH